MEQDVGLKQEIYRELFRTLQNSNLWFNPQTKVSKIANREWIERIDLLLKAPARVRGEHDYFFKIEIQVEIYKIETNTAEKTEKVMTGILWWKKATNKKRYSQNTKVTAEIRAVDKGMKKEQKDSARALTSCNWYDNKLGKWIDKSFEAQATNEKDVRLFIVNSLKEEILEQLNAFGAQLQKAME